MFARGSLAWISTPLVLAMVMTSVSLWTHSMIAYVVSAILFMTAASMAVFFRDPERVVGDGIVSPADGRVAFLDEDEGTLSIVMGLRHVHVTRSPYAGKVVDSTRVRGSHEPAFRDISRTNERIEMIISSKVGDFAVTLITGIVARRILPYVKAGDKLRKGQRIGIIRFGSRVNLSLPRCCRITVPLNHSVRAGESQIAEVIDES
ncbi:MAG: phosphatidylserine decarboxylase [Thermoplasmata archaeon]